MTAIEERYRKDGFFFPLAVVSEREAAELRADLEAGEAELADDPERRSILRTYPDRLLPSFDRLIRHPRLVEAVSQILGPDLMVWGSGLFIKEANSPSYVSWHQDLTYWGLDDVQEVTAWVALSPATVESGCMRFVPGSHRDRIVAHVDSFADDNLLSRGQEVAVEVDEKEAVDIVLAPGEASLHHGHLFHASGPNRTNDRRIGAAIRFITSSMRQRTGDRSVVALVSGEDRYGHFTIAESPKERMSEAGFAICRQDMDIKNRVLFEGAGTQRRRRR